MKPPMDVSDPESDFNMEKIFRAVIVNVYIIAHYCIFKLNLLPMNSKVHYIQGLRKHLVKLKDRYR